MIRSLGKFLIIHLSGILTEEILHQSPERRIVPIRAIDVEDMRPIIKRSLKLLDDSLHMVQRKSLSVDVVFRNEDPCCDKLKL